MKVRLLPIVLFAILISAVPLFAQSDTEIYGSDDGLVTFEYPTDWVVSENSGLITVTNTAEAAEAFQAGENMREGMIAVIIAHISAISILEPAVDPTWSPLEMIEYIVEDSGTSAEISEGDLNGFAGAQVDIINDETESAGVYGAALALDTPTGVVILVLESGDEIDVYGNGLSLIATSLTGAFTSEMPDAPSGEAIRQWAIGAEATSQYGDTSWSAAQATGEPDTDTCGDITTAWASSNSTGQDTLTLEYAVAVIPQEISVYQTYNPGSIISISLITVDGETITLPDSADPPGNTECPGVFKLDVEDVNQLVIGVIIELDQTIGGSWNEIDAVELVGVAGEVFTGWMGEGEITDAEPSQSWEGTFEGGETITITVISNSDFLDPKVQLYSADDLETPLAENDDSRDEELGFTNSRIEDFEIEEGGDYVIVVTRFGGVGDYTLMVEGADGVEFEPNF